MANIVWLCWTHDQVNNAVAAKFWRFTVVHRRGMKNLVRQDSAGRYWEIQITLFTKGVQLGVASQVASQSTSTGRQQN